MGHVSGHLTVVSGDTFPMKRRRRGYRCLCSCGTYVVRQSNKLLRGDIVSCGCRARIRIGQGGQVTHGRSGTTEDKAWRGMLDRCYSKKNTSYHRYGGRGIKVCVEWKTFENFFSDMGERPAPGMSVERKNNDGDYRPGNCVWATPIDQAKNRSTNRNISFSGKKMMVTDWAKFLGMEKGTIFARLRAGWSVKRTLTTPLYEKFSPKKFRVGVASV
jgi:hypothetical protein